MGEQANYQGESLSLRLNGEAAHALREALERLHWSWGYGSSEQVPLRLPDGRTLTLSVRLTNDGEVRDEHGDYLGDDGLAHGDVTGDLRAHADAAQVIDAASRPSWLDVDLEVVAGDTPLDVDVYAGQRADAVLERVGWRYRDRPDWAAQVRERALAAARERLPGELARMREIHQQVQADQRAGDTARARTEHVVGGPEPPGLVM